MSNWIDRALAYAERRYFLSRATKTCPVCMSKQLQLINHFTVPAKYKCRDCKTKFNFEPEER